jgi:hypothetical protein
MNKKGKNINMSKIKNPTKVILGPHTTMSYVNLWAAKAATEGATPKYSVSCIIEKNSPDVEKAKAAIAAAYEAGQSKLKGNSKTCPKLEAIKTPLRDGDLERPDDEAYAGCYFINANSIQQPGIVDVDCNPILDHSEIYSGIRGRVSISFYAYNNAGNRGIAASLNNVQKCSDGKPLGGRATAKADFEDEDDDDSDFLD